MEEQTPLLESAAPETAEATESSPPLPPIASAPSLKAPAGPTKAEAASLLGARSCSLSGKELAVCRICLVSQASSARARQQLKRVAGIRPTFLQGTAPH